MKIRTCAARIGACALAVVVFTMTTEVVAPEVGTAATRVPLGLGIQPPPVKRISVKQRRGMVNVHWSAGVKKATFTYDVSLVSEDWSTSYEYVLGTSARSMAFPPPASAGTQIVAEVVEIDQWGQRSIVAMVPYIIK